MTPSRGVLQAAADVLERTEARLLLSLLILVSVAPLPLEGLWWGFFALFGLELTVRVAALRRRGTGRASEVAILLLDLAATLSFLPLLPLTPEARLLRLVRLAALVGYWFPFLRELVALTLRPERWRQLLFVGVTVLAMCALAAILIGHLGEPLDADGDGIAEPGEQGFAHALWWAFRQIESPDNLVREPSLSLGFVFSFGLTVVGFFLLSFFIGIGTSVVAELVEAARLSRVSLRQHMVILNPSADSHLLLAEVWSYYRKQLRVPKVAVLGSHGQVPDYLRRRELRRLRYRTGNAADPAHLQRVDVADARRVVVLKNSLDGATDAQVVSTVLTVRERNPRCTIYAEVRRAESAAAAVVAGRGHTFPVLTREFQGLILSNLVIFPGIRRLLEQLLSSSGQEIYTCLYGEGVMADVPAPLRSPLPPFPALHRAAQAQGVLLLGGFSVPEERHQTVGRLHLRSLPPDGSAQGIVAIADRFQGVRALGAELAKGRVEDPGSADPGPPLPHLGLPSPHAGPQRVLLCGFREQTLVLLEQLARYAGALDVTVLLPTAQEIAEAREALLAPGPRRLARRRVVFTDEEPRVLRARLPLTGEPMGLLRLAQGDWSILQDLQANALSHDVVVVAAEPRAADPDARTATGLLKLASLLVESPERVPPGFRVVGEVHDEVQARVLEARFAELPANLLAAGVSLELVSTHRIRNEFLAQSIVVPGVTDVLGELLSQGGEQIARLPCPPPGRSAETMTFAHVATQLLARDLVPLALELRGEGGPRVHVNPRPGDDGYTFRMGDLDAVYVVGAVLDGERPPSPRPSPMDLAS